MRLTIYHFDMRSELEIRNRFKKKEWEEPVIQGSA